MAEIVTCSPQSLAGYILENGGIHTCKLENNLCNLWLSTGLLYFAILEGTVKL
jgi:hypothetical protein